MKEKDSKISFVDSIKADFVSKRLWQVGTVVELIGTIVIFIILVGSLIGIIIGLSMAYTSGLISGVVAFALIFVLLIVVPVFTVIVYSIFKLIALHYFSKSKVVYNSDVLANLAVHNTNSDSE